MSSLLSGYEYDIFISYRQNDNRSGWVTTFVNQLQEELAATLKDPVSIYFDENPHDGLLETHSVDKSLEGKLKCMILIPIISQTYCDPKSFAWQYEFLGFRDKAKADQFGLDIRLSNGNVTSRILPVRIHDLDASDLSLFEKESGGVLRSVDFIFRSPGVNRSLTAADDLHRDSGKILYRNQVNKVANAVKEIVSGIKGERGGIGSVRNDSESSARHSVKSGEAKRGIRIPILLALAAVILIALVIFLFGNQKASDPEKSPSSQLIMTPLTTSASFEGYPSWSPDGNLFTYVSLASGNLDIYMRTEKEGDPIQLVKTPYDEYNPRWSPDGSKIAYSSVRDGTVILFWIPSTGGLERKLVETNIPGLNLWEFYAVGTSPWSRNGAELLFSRMAKDGTIAICRINIQTNEVKQTTYPQHGSIDLSASWSPDGNSIVFQRNGRLCIKNMAADQGEQLLLPDKSILSPVFSSDNRKVIFTSSDASGQNIWELNIYTKNLHQLTFSTKWMLNPAVVHNGALSVDQFSHQIDLMVLNLDSKKEEQLTNQNGGNYFGRFSPDGNKVLYQSDRTGNNEIWMINLKEGRREINLTENPAIDFRADWSPDGTQLAFFSDRDSTFKIWTMDVDGRILKKASDVAIEFSEATWGYGHQLKWSPDGKKIAYLASSERGPAVWVATPGDQKAIPVMYDATSFDWYQNGNTIICNRNSADNRNTSELVVVNILTGEERILRQGLPLTELFTSPDGRWLGYTSGLGHFSYNLSRLRLLPPVDSKGFPALAGEPEQLTFGNGKWHVHNGSFSPDAKQVIYSRDTDLMDIFLIRNYK